MAGISDAALNRMRIWVQNTLPDIAIIQAPARVDDGAGGYTITWTPVTGGTVPCLLSSVLYRTGPQEYADREGALANFLLTVPYDAPVAADYRVVVAGTTYEIRGLADAGSWRVSRQALVARLD